MPVPIDPDYIRETLLAGLREHERRCREEPGYAERTEAEARRARERYERWRRVVEGGGDPYGKAARGP